MISVKLFGIVVASLSMAQCYNQTNDSLKMNRPALSVMSNESSANNNFILEDGPDVSDIWSELLLNLTVSRPPTSTRTAKATYAGMPPHHNGYNPYRRIGESPPLRGAEGPNNFVPLRQAPLNFDNRLVSPREVSDTDLYLLSAIEKLVYRVDYLEKRLQKTDKLVLHLMNVVNTQQQQQPPTQQQPTQKPASAQPQTTTSIIKPTPSKPQETNKQPMASTTTVVQSDCPKDFTRIASNCYHIENQTPTDWQTANLRCKTHGGRLAEFEKANELKIVKSHLLDIMGRDTIDLWLGGLNPGLLWIWSSSAKPVDTFNSTNSNSSAATSIQEIKKSTEIAGNGRCLNLMSNPANPKLRYFGEDCSKHHSYLCELRDRTVENTISRVLRALHLD